MVRINETTWIIPTSYGSVFSQISHDQKLLRVYLDNEATDDLLTDNHQHIMQEVNKKGLKVNDFSKKRELFVKEKKTCDQLIKKNEWLLFSLYPLQCSIQTVNYCNAHCDFCYANAPATHLHKNMDFNQIIKLKDYAAVHGVKFGISGGEPLLHPRIYDILKYRSKEVFDTLITNFTAPVNLSELVATNLDLIQVSLHGHESLHNAILGIHDAYQKVFNRMDQIIQRINVATNTVITPKNIDSIELLIQDLSELQESNKKSLTYIRFVPVVPSGTGKDTYNVKEDFFREAESLLKKLERTYNHLNFEVPLFHSNPYEYDSINGKWHCPAGSTVAVVRIDGHVIPCNQFLDTTFSSVSPLSNKDFHSIWLHDEILSKCRKGIATDSNNDCNECMYLLMNQ